MTIFDINRLFYWIPGMTILASSSFTSYQNINNFVKSKRAALENIDFGTNKNFQLDLT